MDGGKQVSPSPQTNGLDTQQDTAQKLNQVSPRDVEPETDEPKDDQLVSQGGMVFFAVGMCFHCLFEGIAVGVFSEVTEMTVVAVGLIIHKIPVSFALGTTFMALK